MMIGLLTTLGIAQYAKAKNLVIVLLLLAYGASCVVPRFVFAKKLVFTVQASQSLGFPLSIPIIGCLLSDVKEGSIKKTDIKSIYSTNFLSNNELLLINNAFILNSDELKSPMGSNLATFSNKDSLTTYLNQMKGKQIFWDELYK